MTRVSQRLYKAHKEKILFLIVGGWNTAFQYGVFALAWYVLGDHLHPAVILLISYVIASINGFLSFRYLVFEPVTHPLIEYLKYQAVYIPLLALNMVVLPLLLAHTDLNAYVAQASFVVFGVIASYLGNKYFTFRRPTRRHESTSSHETKHPEGTETHQYSRQLVAGSNVWWKRFLDVQRPYRWNLRRLTLGKTLDVGCGIGRNLGALEEGSLGVDHNSHSVTIATECGHSAVTTREFMNNSSQYAEDRFDSMLLSHVLEHMSMEDGRRLVEQYLPYVNDKVVIICPQERGFARDATHVTWLDAEALQTLAKNLGLRVVRKYSFPLPTALGRVFAYNETIVVATKHTEA